MCASAVPISKQDMPALRLLGGQSDLSSYRGRLLGRPRGDQEEGSRARTTQALEVSSTDSYFSEYYDAMHATLLSRYAGASYVLV
jgi:hypothetical protein